MGAPEKLPRSGSRPFAPAEARSKIQTTPYQYRTTKQASKHDSIYTNDQGILQLQHATQELTRILTCDLSLGSACRRSTCYGPGLQISGVKLRIGRSTRNREEREEQNGVEEEDDLERETVSEFCSIHVLITIHRGFISSPLHGLSAR